MSTSLLYHAFSIRGYPLKRTLFEYGTVVFEIEVPDDKLRCPNCGSYHVTRYGSMQRQVKHIPIGRKRTFLRVAIPRVECADCRAVRQVRLPFLVEGRTYTTAFERMVLDLSHCMTIQDVAIFMGISWDTAKDIQKRYLTRRFAKPKLRGIRLIAIDEISIAKGHRYLTVVLDLVSGRVVFVGDGKGQDALKPFWKRLKRSRTKISAVAIDMSKAYIEAVQKNLPDATLVFDHFHLVKLFNEKLANFRRELQRQIEDELQKKVLKGTRWLLLKNPEDLDETRNEKARLKLALQLNYPLAVAYYMKEDLRQIWSQPNKRLARRVLKDWIRRARTSDVTMLEKFADTLETHCERILNYYTQRISTGPLEGINNKIGVMKRQAYGYRDVEFLKLKIKGIHETKWALVG